MGHLQANGFKVQKRDVFGKQFTDVKSKYGVPQRLYSCHTAVIDGYVIEGHVPADLIKRMLIEKPTIIGLAVPGMPVEIDSVTALTWMSAARTGCSAICACSVTR